MIAAAPDTPAMGAAEAIAAADAASTHGRSGRFEMTVVSTGKNAKATFLNSTADYTRPDNLTFSLSPAAADALARRYGARPEIYFAGKTLTVDGIVQRELIVNTFSGRPVSANRWQHTVRVQQAAQIIAIR